MIDQLDALIILREKCDKYRSQHGTSFVAQIDDAIGGMFYFSGKNIIHDFVYIFTYMC